MRKSVKKRMNELLEILTVERKIEVTALAERLGVSQVTIRKDLDELEDKKIVIREHGFAILRSSDDINGRIAYHYESKKSIAQKAATLISNGDTIMIESGSCCALLAETLTETKKDLTIITNSAFIADFIRKRANFQIILLGGTYQQDAQVMVGPMVRQCAQNFYVPLFFLGTDGYSQKTGFTNQDQMRAQAVRDMAPQAEQIIILTESEKFSQHGIVPLILKEYQRTVITDDQVDASTVNELEQQGITVLTV